MRKLGFTNRLAVCLLLLLVMCVFMSFYLALESIKAQYLGTLACWTVCFTPMGVCINIVLTAIVNKSKEENTGADGEGIRYRQLLNETDEGGPTI